MNGPHRTHAQAGGFILAVSIIAGTVGGVVAGQSSAGFLVGLAAGIVLTLILWLQDRAR